jgi:uncharacterized protein YjbJ (UPF0337 family)
MKNTVSTDKATWQGRWNEIKGKVKKAHASFTDNDLEYKEGQDDELLGKIQQRLGKTREQVVNWLNSL